MRIQPEKPYQFDREFQIEPFLEFRSITGICPKRCKKPLAELNSYQSFGSTDAFRRGHKRAFVFGGILVSSIQRRNRNPISTLRLSIRSLLSVSLAFSLPLVSAALRAQDSSAIEYRAKANYLANFPSFVEWSSEALPPVTAPFLVCVFGEFTFGTLLADNPGHSRTGAAYRNSLGTKATGTVRLPDFVRKPLGAEEIQPVAGRGARPNGAYRRGNTRVS